LISFMKRKYTRETELTACCGLYCGDCLRFRSKATESARDLIAQLKSMQFDKYANVKKATVKELEHYDECIDVLDAIVKLGCDTPCQAGGEGCSSPCQIKPCVGLKNIEGCWECDELEGCGKFEFLRSVHGDVPKENLRKIRKHGLNEWAKHRGKFYPWL
jgi:hypothetical protein